jgi:hypothetical protein
VAEPRIGLDLNQCLEAVLFWHVKIEKNQARVTCKSGQQIKEHVAIAGDDNLVAGDVIFSKGFGQQRCVIVVVVGYDDGKMVVHLTRN